MFSRKAEPLYQKLAIATPSRGLQGYKQYSRVDVLTSGPDTCHEDTCEATSGPVDTCVMMEHHPDPESDNEDDPTKLLNQWLGELNTLKKVKTRLVMGYKSIGEVIFTLLGIG